MYNFEIGDKVRCVNNDEASHCLNLGEVYTVFYVRGCFISVRPDFIAEIGDWYASRFELVGADLPKYVLVEAKKDEFLEQVNELIAKGYKPQGGVVADQQFYIQAMVLED